MGGWVGGWVDLYLSLLVFLKRAHFPTGPCGPEVEKSSSDPSWYWEERAVGERWVGGWVGELLCMYRKVEEIEAV